MAKPSARTCRRATTARYAHGTHTAAGSSSVLAGSYCSRGLIRKLNAKLRALTGRWLPRRVAFALSVAVISVLLYWLVSGVLFGAFVDFSNSVYAGKNATTRPGFRSQQARTVRVVLNRWYLGIRLDTKARHLLHAGQASTACSL